MTILYKVQNNYSKDSFTTFDTVPTKSVICKISAKNIVAFCVLPNSVYVCDIVTPWHQSKVCSSKHLVSVLEWNYTGDLLLVGYKGGNVEVWSTRHQLLNSWELLYRVSFPSEDIIRARFFHNGKSVHFHATKRDLSSYAEKYERLEARPTVSHFGNTPIEGCLVITASGLLGAFVIPKLGIGANDKFSNQFPLELAAVTHSIGLSRSFVTACSLSHCLSGCFNIAVNCGWREEIIHCFKVSVKLERDEDILSIKCESLASLFLKNEKLQHQKKIAHIRWTAVGSENVILIAYDCSDGSSILEQWNLVKKHQPVHKLLQKTKGDFINCETWENIAKLQLTAGISKICLSKLLTDNMQIYVVLRDNTVQVLDPGLKKVGVTTFEHLADDRQLGCRFVTADVTLMNQLLLVFDNYGQMYAMQVATGSNPTSHSDNKVQSFKHNMSLSLQVSLLEYCIVTGVDASDVVLLNLTNLDALIEKLTENFTRQPAFTRHFYYSNFLSLKSNMCRIQSRQQDFDNLIILHSISITFKSLLRPSDLSCQDKGPADNLAIILSEPLPDVDKVLFNLDAKDFTVEPLTLQSLQQLIQWVADLALNILNKLPDEVMKAKQCKKPGYDISRDIVAIGSIRELLVMIRIWGLLNSQCLPIYTKSVENVDVLSILFRLLTRLAQNTTEPDEMLLDECSILSTQVLIPPRQVNNPTTLLNCHMTVIMSFPFVFTTAVEPLGLQEMQVEEVIFTSGTKDGVSNLQLGSKTKPIRKCVRCGFVNSLQKVAKTSALKAWSHRWLYCHCGGYWKTA